MKFHSTPMNPLITLFFLSAVSAWAGELSFSSMEDGDRVEITRESTGCFHHTKEWYEVQRSAGECFLTQYAITWKKDAPGQMTGKQVLGKVKLSKNDVAGLDGLLRFYRGKKEVSTTTQTDLMVEYYEGAKRVGVENLHDESGGYGLSDRKDVTSFGQLMVHISK
jgi:hypothetical protein